PAVPDEGGRSRHSWPSPAHRNWRCHARGRLRRPSQTSAGKERAMSALGAILYREGKIRTTNLTFIFWDVFYPLGYLLVFGVGISETLGFTAPTGRLGYS